MRITSRYFSNKKLKLWDPLIISFISDIIKREKKLDQAIERIKLRVYHSRPLLMKATPLNELKHKMKELPSNVAYLKNPLRQDFISQYKLKEFCEGCRREPIQEDAHIIKNSAGKKIKRLSKYLHHYANLWLLCGTCHKIVDGKGGNVSKRRENLTVNNLKKSRPNIQRRIRKDLQEYKKDLLSKTKLLNKLSRLPREKTAEEISVTINRYSIKK